MADLKISDLPTDITALADGDKFPVADASALTADTFATALEIKTYSNTAPKFSAGSTTANSHPEFTTGTLLTTPEAGAMEYANSQLYFTPDSTNRGAVMVKQYIRQAATYTLTSATTVQKLFNATANGALTLPTGTYLFVGQASISAMSATSGNGSLSLAGTATLANPIMHVVGIDGAAGTAAAQTGAMTLATATAANAVTAAVNTVMNFSITGSFEVSVTGTVIPSIALQTAAAAIVAAGSYFWVERIGDAGVTSLGNWS